MSDENNIFIQYLEQKDIEIINSSNIKIKYREKYCTEEDLLYHIETLCDFQAKVMGFKDYLRVRLNNKIGKTIEQYKVSLKRLKKDIRRLERKKDLNEFEKSLVKFGPKYIEIGKEALSVIDKPSYINFILRSMEREEICLDKVWFNNVLRDKEKIYIKDISSVSYNLIEMDCIEFIKKLRRRGIKTNYQLLCHEFCKKSKLGNDSEEFILSISSFPSEFMMCCDRYRDKRKNWTIDMFNKRLNEAMEHESETLLGGNINVG